jgi:pseudouridine-5'-phosphate glycosidase
VTGLIRLAPEVAEALAAGRPVVALETTLVAHGFPAGEGARVGLESEARVRAAGAVPATVGVIEGRVRVGLAADEIERYDGAADAARKVGPRDLAACAVQGALGATTIGGTLAAARAAGISVVATGGLGGVHRDWARTLDVSADLGELARARVAVVASGAKSLLDVEATAELLESLGVPVLGLGTDTVPLFYTAAGGPPVSARVEHAREAAAVIRAHWDLGRPGGVLVAQPPPEDLDVLDLIEEEVAAAAHDGVRGQAVTPRVLARLHERTGGRTLRANHALVTANARVGGELAVALAGLG